MGGLGNQMFQYAAARRLAHVHNAILILDVSWFSEIASTETPRSYALSYFAIQERFASPDELVPFKISRFQRGLVRILGTRLPVSLQRHVLEQGFQFDPGILNLPDNVYLDGHWQSPYYFSDIQDLIQTEFNVRERPDHANTALAVLIANAGDASVSLHVRRQDYISNPSVSRLHGACTKEYYVDALRIMSERLTAPHFFIFSDDPGWVRENLSLPDRTTIVDHNDGNNPHEDLRLMRSCKHHIIANSSFSWWGAWLQPDKRKIVIAPARWFRGSSINADSLLPAEWIKV